MRANTLSFVLILSLTTAAVAQPSLVRLVATADASADADQPTVNFGSATLVTSGKTFTNTPTFRVWMTRGHYQFDLSAAVGRPLPTRARLRVYQETSMAAGCLDVTVHRVTQPWTESALTWQNKPTHDPAVEARQCVGDSFDPGFKNFDVTALVHAWLQATVPNYGLVIRDPTESTAGAARPLHATSRESAMTDRQPQLELAWDTVPFGSGCGPNTTAPTLDIESGAPARGGAYTLMATGFASGSVVVHLIGASNATWSGVPLPYNLASIGYPACNLLVSADSMLAGVADSRGRAQLAIPVPNSRFLPGRSVYHQSVAVDANQRLAFTNGFAVRFF